jgi:hypothetical protein
MKTELDELDQQMLNERFAARQKIKRPAIGDYVIFPDAHLERFSHDWGDRLQTSTEGSFFLLDNGNGDFSGGLNSAIKLEHFTSSDLDSLNARFWFFHHDQYRAHNGVTFQIPVKVWECASTKKPSGENMSNQSFFEPGGFMNGRPCNP